MSRNDLSYLWKSESMISSVDADAALIDVYGYMPAQHAEYAGHAAWSCKWCGTRTEPTRAREEPGFVYAPR